MRRVFVLASVLLSPSVWSQVAPFDYHLQAVRITEDAKSIVIHMPTPLFVQVLPGGHTWPLLTLDEDGRIYVGSTIIDSRHGKVLSFGASETSLALPHGYNVSAGKGEYRISRGTKACPLSQQQLGLNGRKSNIQALKDGNLIFGASDHELIALVTQFGGDNSEDTYLIAAIDLGNCKVSRASLGNPDLLVELGRSKQGGWWLTGSIEQTLLRSKDGRYWHKVVLPANISSLVSSYVVNDQEIWLAGILPGNRDDDPLLIYSGDGGKRWRSIARNDPLLERLPNGWLEGRKRLGQVVEQGIGSKQQPAPANN
jgi:hypothetical protein